MVYVNNKKFACESCIKGHRSSSCHHSDRPLFEIKKKGRPVSQCEKCRELRQSKKVHSKCTCNPKADPASRGEVLASTTSKSRRFIPIVPALPNGLKDILAASQIRTSLPADARQRVDSLLNPCNCRSVWRCNCRPSQPPATVDQATLGSIEDLDILAHVATMHRRSSSMAPSLPLMSLDRTAKTALPRIVFSAPTGSSKRYASRSSSPLQGTYKRSKQHHHHSHDHDHHSLSPVLELPPIQSSPESTPPLTDQVPDFGFMPPISTINSLAGSGCTCGVQCACPGCVEHRGSQHAAKDLHDCTDGQCGTCVDNQSGVALQSSTSPLSSISGSPPASFSLDYITKSSSLNRFFARAAALPPPPQYRRLGNGIQLDPREVGYNPGKTPSVNLPKLECCGGRCSCPNDQCVCGAACGGCCGDADSSTPLMEVPSENIAGSGLSLDDMVPMTLLNAASERSCCAGTPS